MARIELKNCVVRFKDGFGGTAAVNDTPAQDDTTLEIDTLAGLPDNATEVPVGGRFMVVGDSDTIFVVTGVNSNERQLVTVTGATGGNFTLDFMSAGPTGNILYDATAGTVQTALEGLSNIDSGDVLVTGSAGGPWTIEFKGQYLATDVAMLVAADVDLTGTTPTVDATLVNDGAITWELTFTPAIQSGQVPVDDAVITFYAQQIDIKIGDGNITYTENKNYEYDLDRGLLDTVREGDQAPMDVNIDFVYEFITTGTSEAITPMDALKQQGGASGWFSSSADPCEPYAIDIEVVYTPPCGGAEMETTTFPDFRPDTKEVDFGEASVSVPGRCNATEPTVVRTAQP
jgi:hypothetical protein